MRKEFLKINRDYVYKEGEIIDNIKIIELIRVKNGKSTCKGYRLKCLNDNYEWEATEYSLLKGKKCPVCCKPPRVIIKGINDIATTHPHLVKYFVNIEDSYNHSYCSTDKVLLKCPNCGKTIYKRIELLRYGYICPQCSDGISMPNKFMCTLLDMLSYKYNIKNIKTEYSPFWITNKRYDFYFEYNNEKYIIEMNGEQHYKESGFKKKGGRTLEEEQKNDKYKKELALQNGIKPNNYIVIDCRESEFDFIRNNTIKQFKLLFNLDGVDWINIFNKCQKSKVKEVCDYWHEHKEINGENISTLDIAKIFKISDTTIRLYLKKGNKLNWCNYKPIKYKTRGTSKKVRCIELNKIFNSCVEASKYTNINANSISQNALGKLKSAGKLHWEYI